MLHYTLEDQRMILEEYLKVKLQQRDWHGVRDVCVDIEILEALIKKEQEIEAIRNIKRRPYEDMQD